MKDLYLDLLKNVLLDNIYGNKLCTNHLGKIRKATEEEIRQGSVWPVNAHTMLGTLRMDNLRYCVEYCIENDIAGDLLEAGVWRGGACIFMNAILKANNIENRKIYVADSFKGLPAPEPERYSVDEGDKHYSYDFLRVSQEEVEKNFRLYNLLTDNIVFVSGFFEDTLKYLDIESLAVLRVDGDMYSSTIQILEALYDKVSEGGFIILDDFPAVTHGAYRAKRAAIDFRSERGIESPIIRVDVCSAYWQKEKTDDHRLFSFL